MTRRQLDETQGSARRDSGQWLDGTRPAVGFFPIAVELDKLGERSGIPDLHSAAAATGHEEAPITVECATHDGIV